jgi:uncharacterized membrane protein YeaQ/YmgE (transglycosylase-associated protein family)
MLVIRFLATRYKEGGNKVSKFMSFLAVCVFATVLSGTIYGRTAEEEKQAVRNYLDVLDAKLEIAKKQNQSAKVVLLHAQKATALALVAEDPVVYKPDTAPETFVIVTQPAVTQTAAIPPTSVILYWIVFGLAVGSLANFVVTGSRRGIVGSIFLGIIGSVVGGYLGLLFFDVGVTGFNVPSFILAIAGSLLVILVDRLLRTNNI